MSKFVESISRELTEAPVRVEGDLNDFKHHLGQIDMSLTRSKHAIDEALAMVKKVAAKADTLGDPGWQRTAWPVYHEANTGTLSGLTSSLDDIRHALTTALNAK